MLGGKRGEEGRGGSYNFLVVVYTCTLYFIFITNRANRRDLEHKSLL